SQAVHLLEQCQRHRSRYQHSHRNWNEQQIHEAEGAEKHPAKERQADHRSCRDTSDVALDLLLSADREAYQAAALYANLRKSLGEAGSSEIDSIQNDPLCRGIEGGGGCAEEEYRDPPIGDVTLLFDLHPLHAFAEPF